MLYNVELKCLYKQFKSTFVYKNVAGNVEIYMLSFQRIGPTDMSQNNIILTAIIIYFVKHINGGMAFAQHAFYQICQTIAKIRMDEKWIPVTSLPLNFHELSSLT